MPTAVFVEAPRPDGEGGTVPAVNEEVPRPEEEAGKLPAVNEVPRPDEPAPAAVNEAPPRPDMARGTEKTRPKAIAELGGAAPGDTSRLDERRRPSGPAELGPPASSVWATCREPEVGAFLGGEGRGGANVLYCIQSGIISKPTRVPHQTQCRYCS